ncbi:SHOCT domain-containing protein [Geodermatophilus sabuli]|uniref:Short C-terminal domain-containing protein n=1 Tax=Geodermatophilus sabuli TaxID=1564158 RepID=A0A285EH34_9ACTN|nr:SHOCT domain-containing protein [Geodermatophilus sabuli]MBB3084464.1 type VI protein secretion system component VasK [Geodermatophilus sabuli]SNX97341.1 Short C-terminal domain-containing protein [Geodermatophilus sabuli]
MRTAADDYPLLDLMWTFVLFFALMVYFWLVVTVFGDLFRRHDTSGWAKTAWAVFVLVVPLIGSLTYLITQGRAMADRNVQQADRARQGTDAYIRSVAAPGLHGIDEIARAKGLLDEGAISQEEFEQLKRRVLV